jgi:dihydroxyacid dehydratase/phosphogluconate dehydratase
MLGGLPVVIKALSQRDMLHDDTLTVTGKGIAENCKDATNWNEEVIRPFDNPLVEQGSIAVLRGNLAPGGAVLKPSAASPHLLRHRGPAVVFKTIEHYRERIADPNLQVEENSVLVLQNCGPKGYPGMAEVGNMGLPPKLLAKGITDMVRISDARMSGTAYGTVILHVCPEAATGGPLGLIEDGDKIELDVEARRLTVDFSDEELARRARVGSLCCRNSMADINRCMFSMYCRLLRERIWTFWLVAVEQRFRGNPTDERSHGCIQTGNRTESADTELPQSFIQMCW